MGHDPAPDGFGVSSSPKVALPCEDRVRKLLL